MTCNCYIAVDHELWAVPLPFACEFSCLSLFHIVRPLRGYLPYKLLVPQKLLGMRVFHL